MPTGEWIYDNGYMQIFIWKSIIGLRFIFNHLQNLSNGFDDNISSQACSLK